jgi:hypothetical protein
LPVGSGETAIYEAYKPGTEPGKGRAPSADGVAADAERGPVAATAMEGEGAAMPVRGAPASGTGGLY